MRAVARPLLCCLALALLVGLVYSNSLENGFHYDDYHSIVENPGVRQLARIPAFFTDVRLFSAWPDRAMYRPLVLVTYALNYRLGGYQVRGYHLANLVAHAACALLVCALGRLLGLGPGSAALGALLFALHPVQAETANYISTRSESLACLGLLGSLAAYGRWRLAGPGGQGRRGWYALSVASYLLGLLSKSTAIVLPAALLLWEAAGLPNRSPSGRWRGLWRYHLPYWVASAAYLVVTGSMVAAAVASPVRPLWTQWATQVKAAAHYLRLLAMPVGLSVEHQFSEAPGLLAVPVLAPLALLGSALAIAVRARGRGRGEGTLALLLGWAVLSVLPSSLVPLHVLVNEHRLYPALAFAAPALGLLAAGGRRRWRLPGTAFLLLFAVTTYQRNRVWQNELTLWQDAVAKAPVMYRSHLHLGGALEAWGDLPGALRQYQEAVRLAPQALETHYNLGNALRRSGRTVEAEAAYAHCLELNPRYVPALLNLAGMAMEARDAGRAEELLRRAEQAPVGSAQLPSLAAAHYNLANLYYAQGGLVGAIGHYGQAIRLEPGHADAHYNLGDLYLGANQPERAAEVFAQGLARAPDAFKLLYGLARAQEALGQRAAALETYRRFLRHAGPYPQVRDRVESRIRDLAGSAP